MSSKKGAAPRPSSAAKGFTVEERAAMRERIREMRAAAAKDDGAKAVREKISQMKGSDRTIAERLHALIQEVAPHLVPRTWYGMPAYARAEKIVCFYQPAAKFGVRYATLGFSDEAKLDDGRMWPTAYAITALTPSEEGRIRALVRAALE